MSSYDLCNSFTPSDAKTKATNLLLRGMRREKVKEQRRGIQLIAKLADVSVGTVDRALQGRVEINESHGPVLSLRMDFPVSGETGEPTLCHRSFWILAMILKEITQRLRGIFVPTHCRQRLGYQKLDFR